MFLSTWFLLVLKVAVYFLVFTLSLKLADFAVIFGIAFLTVTFVDAVEGLIISDPAYLIFTLYVFGALSKTCVINFNWHYSRSNNLVLT